MKKKKSEVMLFFGYVALYYVRHRLPGDFCASYYTFRVYF